MEIVRRHVVADCRAVGLDVGGGEMGDEEFADCVVVEGEGGECGGLGDEAAVVDRVEDGDRVLLGFELVFGALG